MTPEQAAAFISAQIALFSAEIALLEAENLSCSTRGTSTPYGEEAFQEVIKRYEGVIGHNAVLETFQQVNRYR